MTQVLSDLGRQPELFDQFTERADAGVAEALESLSQKIGQHTTRLQTIDDRLGRLIRIFGEQDDIPQVLREECSRLDHGRNDTRAEIGRLEEKTRSLQEDGVDLQVLRHLLGELERHAPALSLEEQKHLLQRLIGEIVVNRWEGDAGQIDAADGGLQPEIRTDWFQVNISIDQKTPQSKALRGLYGHLVLTKRRQFGIG